MRKRIFALLVILSGLGFIFCLSSCEKKGGEPIILQFSEPHPESHLSVETNKEFARIIEEKSNGQIKIEVIPDAQLYDIEGALEHIREGDLAFTVSNTSSFSSVSKIADAFQLPYIFKDRDHMFNVLDSDIGAQVVADIENEFDAKVLGFYDTGSRNIYTTMPLQSLKDLNGLRIRVHNSEMSLDFFAEVGANSVPLEFLDIYDAIKTDVIDGAENDLISYYSAAHYEVAKYYYRNRYKRVPNFLLVSNKVLNSLSEEQQQIIIEAGKEAQKYIYEKWEDNEEEILKELWIHNCVITEAVISGDEEEQIDKFYNRYPQYSEIIDRIRNVQ